MIEVVDQTILQAIFDIEAENCLCLNFASAKNPGGGWLTGANAQEESIARSSGLFTIFQHYPNFFIANSYLKNCYYTDNVIYSPCVPVFRDDNHRLVKPVPMSFITAPAVNIGGLKQNRQFDNNKAVEIMKYRINKVLSISAIHSHRTLLLGAWGCGAFQNDPEIIAKLFKEALCGTFDGVFEKIRFVIYTTKKDQENFNIFKSLLGY